MQQLFIIVLLGVVSVNAIAGNLQNGKWAPADCGENPQPQILDTSDVDAYNASVKRVNEWQQKAQVYISCVVNEANADNTRIANAATETQNAFRAQVEKIKADASASKFDKK